ncbi:GGDEF domain-containing protein [Streptomyces sp. F-1]|uniref:GGDEF domain-containing protein n=1 Tax=Streptomyces sp. F-1 TaxID=463642 RepID=UPI00086A2EC6|nr:GGDEF domain-containing protein [Streptomyces sp. F-1]SFY53191.1 putative diguanylate cyclase YegE [Streptomyces sp. F-1]
MNDLLTMVSAAGPLAGGWGVHWLWMRRRLSAARRDPLSGLWTRAPFERRAARLVARRPHAAVVLVDLDGFKALNDTFGHAAGDEAIRATAASLNDALAEKRGAVAARLGGDEFAAVVPLEEPFTLPWLLNALHGAFTAPFTYRGRTIRVGASIGACLTAELSSRSLPLALRRADEAMYTAKRDGGGWCVADGPDLTHSSRTGRRAGRPGTSGKEAA